MSTSLALARASEDDVHADTLPGNVLPAGNAAPALLSHQRSLERHMRSDSLEQQLASRPPPEVLVKEGILKGESVLSGHAWACDG